MKIAQAFVISAATLLLTGSAAFGTERIQYNNPGLTVDLGVGLWAWPMPMDWDSDGDLDLVVSCPDKPYNGTYWFENPGLGRSDRTSDRKGNEKFPVFLPAKKVGDGFHSVQVSYVNNTPRVLRGPIEYVDFLGKAFDKQKQIYPKSNIHPSKVRANQWRYVDFDGDGTLDLTVGVGDWADYGWDDAYNTKGEWTNGPLHGYVYVIRNKGTDDKPDYDKPSFVIAGSKRLDVYGMPTPNFADFDGDGDLDLLCGEFLDGFTYFKNTGTRTVPEYATGIRLMSAGKPIAMDLQMITPTAVDWDADGDVDVVCGDEDGRVALIENVGRMKNGAPEFKQPVYFKQQASDVKFGALATPVSVDWDGDGDEDIVSGNTAGYVALIENLDAGNPPRWAAPVYLNVDGRPLRILAGPNGSIQGPAEAKWGYTTLDVADWNHDGLLDLVVNSIWGKIEWFENEGTKTDAKLVAAKPIHVEWNGPAQSPKWNWWKPNGNEMATQWRTTPVVIDLNRDGRNDLVMLDHEGYLSFYERLKSGNLKPGQRRFKTQSGEPLRLNSGDAGKSGRRKWCFGDWNDDGKIDLLVNSRSVDLWTNVGEDGEWIFREDGPVTDHRLAGHTTSPTMVDWDGDGKRDLLVGAEDGFFYYIERDKHQIETTVLETEGMTLSGGTVKLKPFVEDAVAFGNRNYVWKDVPDRFSNWSFTQLSGGESTLLGAIVKRDMTLYVATAGGATATPKGVDLRLWTKVDSPPFHYTDRGNTRMAIYQRRLKSGSSVSIPQGNWTGTILLVPPTSEAVSR